MKRRSKRPIYAGAVLSFRPDLALLKVDHSRKCQIFILEVQGTDRFSVALAMDHKYEFHLCSGLSISLNRPHLDSS